jgi:hypothetical protein
MKYILQAVILGVIIGLSFKFIPKLVDAKKPNLKRLDLPEEFMQITKGDTLGIFESNDTIYLEFYKGNIKSNSKYKLLISN